ncbi:epoxide hydrolase [Tanacetum coccineum]
MGRISHRFVLVNGLKLHVAEIGLESSPAVIFLHGFPEIWYTWRHQMLVVADAGFRAIAQDFRGYGLSESPAPEKAIFADLSVILPLFLMLLPFLKNVLIRNNVFVTFLQGCKNR